MKTPLKQLLRLTGLWPMARTLHYHLTGFVPHSRHPRRRMARFYSQFIAKGDLCFDVGAHLGERTSLFLELGARVVAIEPQQACLQALKKAYQHNRNVVLVGKGLAAHGGSGLIAICDESPVLSTLSPKWRTEGRFSPDNGFHWNRSETVELTTLDELIRTLGKPSFCKIDVEGYESEVLHGLSQPIDFLSFEYCREMLEETRACLDHLTGLGSYRFAFLANEPFGPFPPFWLNAEELLVDLAKNPDPLVWGDIYARLDTASRPI